MGYFSDEPTAVDSLPSYRLDYAQSTASLPNSGYYYVQMSDSHYGSYSFTYYKGLKADNGELPFLYTFQHQPKGSSEYIETWYAPLWGDFSASGLYHNSAETTEESGNYMVLENGVDVEHGTYNYYLLRRSGGWGGYLSEATFAYIYHPTFKRTSPGY